MLNVLQSIYYGNEAISVRTFNPATRYAWLMKETSLLEDKLKAALHDNSSCFQPIAQPDDK